jgi:hypothetical protein
MWLKRLTKFSDQGMSAAPGGADLGVASNNILGLDGDVNDQFADMWNILYNKHKKRKKPRKWHSSKDQPRLM